MKKGTQKERIQNEWISNVLWHGCVINWKTEEKTQTFSRPGDGMDIYYYQPAAVHDEQMTITARARVQITSTVQCTFAGWAEPSLANRSWQSVTQSRLSVLSARRSFPYRVGASVAHSFWPLTCPLAAVRPTRQMKEDERIQGVFFCFFSVFFFYLLCFLCLNVQDIHTGSKETRHWKKETIGSLSCKCSRTCHSKNPDYLSIYLSARNSRTGIHCFLDSFMQVRATSPPYSVLVTVSFSLRDCSSICNSGTAAQRLHSKRRCISLINLFFLWIRRWLTFLSLFFE